MNVLIAGDYSPRYDLNKIISEGNYELLFKEIIPIVSQNDYSIVNFETTVPTNFSHKIFKNGPNLHTVEASVDALKYAGFNVASLANNHIYDYGEEGLANTISLLKSNGIKCVGAGKNLKDAEKSICLSKEGQRVAIINCCEHEFSIATESKGGANPLNPISQYNSIQNSKREADFVIVIVHGGHEHFQLPSLRMQETYRFFIDAGADVVVNHHQHCYSGMEEYNGGYIFYGLGNFLFDRINSKNSDGWNKGYMLQLQLVNRQINYSLIPYTQCLNKQGISLLKSDSEIQEFMLDFNRLSNIIANPSLLKKEIEEFYLNIASKDIWVSFEPYNNRLLAAAYNRNLLPSFLSSTKLAHLLNLVECESHNDIVKFLFHRNLK